MFSNVTRKRYTAGSYVDGRWAAGGSDAATIIASVQPVRSQAELLLLPEAARTRGSVKIYTEDSIRTADESTQTPADRIVWDGEEWEVHVVDTWVYGIAHSRAIAVRVER